MGATWERESVFSMGEIGANNPRGKYIFGLTPYIQEYIFPVSIDSITSPYRSPIMYDRNAIDEAAEREAIAIESLDAMIDREADISLLKRRLYQAAQAAEMGLPAPQSHRYKRVDSYRAFERIFTAFHNGNAASNRRFNVTTKEDRERQAANRERLRELAARPMDDSPVTIVEAAKLFGIGDRTILRHVTEGKIAVAGKAGKARLIRPSDVQAFIAAKYSAA